MFNDGIHKITASCRQSIETMELICQLQYRKEIRSDWIDNQTTFAPTGGGLQSKLGPKILRRKFLKIVRKEETESQDCIAVQIGWLFGAARRSTKS